MTAVAVQQSPHGSHRQQYSPRQSPHSSNMSPNQPRPQSYTSSGQAQLARQESASQNGITNGTGSRQASNSISSQQNGNRLQPSDEEERPSTSTRKVTVATNSAGNNRRTSLQARPSSAPNGIGESSQDDSETDRVRRRPKPLLQRAKSDFGPRGEEPDTEEETQDWGARHGFEDHYASEEYVSQLANVSCVFSFGQGDFGHRGRYSQG